MTDTRTDTRETRDTRDSRLEQARAAAGDFKDRAAGLAQDARERASEAYGSARERAIEAYDQARERAASARVDAGRKVNDNPLAAIGAGLAVGALIGALLPRSERERKALSRVGERLSDGARNATAAARDAGRATLADFNFAREADESFGQSITRGLGDAARSASQAALGAVRKAD